MTSHIRLQVAREKMELENLFQSFHLSQVVLIVLSQYLENMITMIGRLLFKDSIQNICKIQSEDNKFVKIYFRASTASVLQATYRPPWSRLALIVIILLRKGWSRTYTLSFDVVCVTV